MSGILEQVRGSLNAVRHEQEAAAAAMAERYEQAVIDVAAGKDVKPTEVMAALEAVGKTLDQFEHDVSDRKHFDEWTDAVAKEPAALALKEKLDAQAAEFMERRKKIEAELRAEAVKIGEQQEAVDRELRNIRDYKRRIHDWNMKRSAAFKRLSEPAPKTGFPITYMTADEANSRYYDEQGRPQYRENQKAST